MCSRGVIYRKRCSRCKISFSLHPEFLLKRQQYSLQVVAAWLWAFLDGAGVRCEAFLQRYAVGVIGAGPSLSWSDSLDFHRTLPGYQLLQRWSSVFCARARKQLPELMNAAIVAGVDRIAEGRKVVEKAQALETGWLYWEALCRMESTTGVLDTGEIFRQLVRQLTKSPSHKARRAISGHHLYDVLIL